MQYVCNLTQFTRMCVTSHSQPLINTKYKFQVTNYLQTIFQTITNEPIGLILLIASWLTIYIAPFTLGQMNIIITPLYGSKPQYATKYETPPLTAR
jgi:hypothetical protein